MASLAVTVRAGVAQAAQAVGALLVEVTLHHKSGTDGDGKPTFDAEDDTTHMAFVEHRVDRKAQLMGVETVAGPTVLFLENLEVGAEDRITLPDETVVAVKAVESIPDPAGGVFYAKAICGAV